MAVKHIPRAILPLFIDLYATTNEAIPDANIMMDVVLDKEFDSGCGRDCSFITSCSFIIVVMDLFELEICFFFILSTTHILLIFRSGMYLPIPCMTFESNRHLQTQSMLFPDTLLFSLHNQ